MDAREKSLTALASRFASERAGVVFFIPRALLET
jgi:hypothetical protein